MQSSISISNKKLLTSGLFDRPLSRGPFQDATSTVVRNICVLRFFLLKENWNNIIQHIYAKGEFQAPMDWQLVGWSQVLGWQEQHQLLQQEVFNTGWQKLAAFRRGQKWPQNFCQAPICYFRDKCSVLARNCKFANFICNIYHVILHFLPDKDCI